MDFTIPNCLAFENFSVSLNVAGINFYGPSSMNHGLLQITKDKRLTTKDQNNETSSKPHLSTFYNYCK